MFWVKIALYPMGLHPFKHMTTPFWAYGYTLFAGWCSPFQPRYLPCQCRFRRWERPFLLVETPVSLNGDGSFSYWERQFLRMGTLVSYV